MIASCTSNKDQCQLSLLALLNLIKEGLNSLTPLPTLTLGRRIMPAWYILLKNRICRIQSKARSLNNQLRIQRIHFNC